MEYAKSSNEQKTAQYDLEAQQQMAEWALMMFVATSAGVVLLFFTWRETARVTIETRSIGEAQVRAYLTFGKVEIIYNSHRNFLAAIIEIKNSGQSPPENFKILACCEADVNQAGMVKTFPVDGSGSVENWRKPFNQSLVAPGSSEFYEITFPNTHFGTNMSNNQLYRISRVQLDARLDAQDVFGNPMTGHLHVFRIFSGEAETRASDNTGLETIDGADNTTVHKGANTFNGRATLYPGKIQHPSYEDEQEK